MQTVNIATMTHDELLAYCTQLQNENAILRCDPFTGLMNAQGAFTYHKHIPAGKTLIMVDMCNVHAMNHLYTMNGTNERWVNIFSELRLTDTVIKYGGDEFVIIINDGDVTDFIARLDQKVHDNDCYAIYAVVTTSNELKESIDRADAIVSEVKLSLELNGMKPGRDEVYKVLDSHVIYE